ncbi:MAG: prolipoprotein diacylglyceryl transferase [bacterium]|nr:prolipoprotein diacylglyceryl transferase [bacterium]
MPAPFTTLGSLTFQTYTLLVGVGVVTSAALIMWQLRTVEKPGVVMDCLLAGLIMGLLLARVGHVALHWDTFRHHPAEIGQLRAGGLDWHGAVVGGLIGSAMAARLRRVHFPTLLRALAPVLPLLTFFGWWGCGAARCAYGAEVDNLAYYPAWLVWEGPDLYNLFVPRYRLQALGMGLAIMLFALWVLMRVLKRRQSQSDVEFWLLLMLMAVGMFLLGFLRGDIVPIIRRLRADQWLDAAIFCLGLAGVLHRAFRPQTFGGFRHKPGNTSPGRIVSPEDKTLR